MPRRHVSAPRITLAEDSKFQSASQHHYFFLETDRPEPLTPANGVALQSRAPARQDKKAQGRRCRPAIPKTDALWAEESEKPVLAQQARLELEFELRQEAMN